MLNGLRERFKDENDIVLQEVLARAEREAGERTKQINLAYQTLARRRAERSCPQCGDKDRVTKVSGLVSAQSRQGRVVTSERRQATHYTSGGYPASTSRGQSAAVSHIQVSTELSRKLRPNLGRSGWELMA